MAYAKVTSEQALQYPYDWNDLYRENPYTSYDSRYDLTQWYSQTEDAIRNTSKLVTVLELPVPSHNAATQKAIRQTLPTLSESGWILAWDIVEKTPDELAVANLTVPVGYG